MLLLTATGPAAGDADLGRLFFSAAERAGFDAYRAEAARPPAVEVELPAAAAVATDAAQVVAPPPPSLKINGIVSRSRGPATVWLNGVAQDPRQARVPGVKNLGVTRDAVVIQFEGAQPVQRLRAGETFDPETPAPAPDATRADAKP